MQIKKGNKNGLLALLIAGVLAAIGTFGLTQLLLNLTRTTATPKTHGYISNDPELDAALQVVMTTRVCGSPAVDGYAHVKPQCLRDSPTAKWWQKHNPDPYNDLVTHIERQADYDGLAVAWGIDNKKATIEECAAACRDHKPNPNDLDGFGALPCNAFVWCSVPKCFEPDAHQHSKGDCWLKFTEAPASPEINMRGRLTTNQRRRHPTAPKFVEWHAGVLLPRGVVLTNGTFGPRFEW